MTDTREYLAHRVMKDARDYLAPELLKCPMCANSAQFSVCVDYATVFCTSCGLQTRSIRSYESSQHKVDSAAQLWNMRSV